MRIGIIVRPDLSRASNQVWTVNNEIRNVILKYDALPVAIIPTNIVYEAPLSIKEWNMLLPLLNSCDGFIFQGGDDYYDYDFQILNYLVKRDVPVLGICLGMQTMCAFCNGDIKKIQPFHFNHHQHEKKYVHLVNIHPNTKLSEILKTDTIKVNSRHKEYVAKTSAMVSATSSDDIVEAIELSDKTFFIGVQWHPESMIEYDKMSNLLFDEFFHSARRKYESKRVSRGNGSH